VRLRRAVAAVELPHSNCPRRAARREAGREAERKKWYQENEHVVMQ
jgi:hypothetical protein